MNIRCHCLLNARDSDIAVTGCRCFGGYFWKTVTLVAHTSTWKTSTRSTTSYEPMIRTWFYRLAIPASRPSGTSLLTTYLIKASQLPAMRFRCEADVLCERFFPKAILKFRKSGRSQPSSSFSRSKAKASADWPWTALKRQQSNSTAVQRCSSIQ